MNGKLMAAVLATIVLVLANNPLAAKPASVGRWMPMTDAELIGNSDLIVIGKIVWVENGEVSTQSRDKASILIEEVLKGGQQEVMVPLEFPGRNRGYKTWKGSFQSTRVGNDIFFDIDQEGVWFLRKNSKTGNYVIKHPACFKPLFFKEKIIKAVRDHR